MIKIDGNKKHNQLHVEGTDTEFIQDIANLAAAFKENNTLSKEILIQAIELGYAENDEESAMIIGEKIVKLLIEKNK